MSEYDAQRFIAENTSDRRETFPRCPSCGGQAMLTDRRQVPSLPSHTCITGNCGVLFDAPTASEQHAKLSALGKKLMMGIE